MPILSKSMVVPQFGNYNAEYTGTVAPYSINLFTPNTASPSSPPILAAAIDLSKVFLSLNPPIDPTQYPPSPNACAAFGTDLYVTISSYPASAAAILKFTGYFLGKNTTATVQATIFSDAQGSYTGLAFDGTGVLHVVANDASIYAYPTQSMVAGHAVVTVTGQAYPAVLGDIAFDQAGNLWVTDYNNATVIGVPKAGLAGTNAPYTVVAGAAGPFTPVNVDPTLNATADHVFTSPEGVAFDGQGNLWVGNNNDGGDDSATEGSGPRNPLTSVVQLTPPLLGAILGAAIPGGAPYSLTAGTSLSLTQVQSATPPAGFAVYQLPGTGYARPQLGGMQIDAIAPDQISTGAPQYLYANDEENGTVRQFDVNPQSPGFLASIAPSLDTALTLNDAGGNDVVSNPGNGGIALVSPSLVVGDWSGDTGAEPDTSIPAGKGFWETTLIGVGSTATAPADFGTLNTIDYDPDGCYVYVGITNFGTTPTDGTERVRIYFTDGAIAQSWPVPWTEIQTSAGNLGIIQPGDTTVLALPWSTMPNPADYGGNEHWCLLARIETRPVYPFGMTFWEKTITTDPGDALLLAGNILNNSKIAQRNVWIQPAGEIIIQHMFKVIAGNFGHRESVTSIGFELLNDAGAPIPLGGGKLHVHARESWLERLLEWALECLEHLGEGLFHLKFPHDGLGVLRLKPGERMPLTLGFTPPPGVREFALRVTQRDLIAGKEEVVGGQTFVIGKVTGFSG